MLQWLILMLMLILIQIYLQHSKTASAALLLRQAVNDTELVDDRVCGLYASVYRIVFVHNTCPIVRALDSLNLGQNRVRFMELLLKSSIITSKV